MEKNFAKADSAKQVGRGSEKSPTLFMVSDQSGIPILIANINKSLPPVDSESITLISGFVSAIFSLMDHLTPIFGEYVEKDRIRISTSFSGRFMAVTISNDDKFDSLSFQFLQRISSPDQDRKVVIPEEISREPDKLSAFFEEQLRGLISPEVNFLNQIRKNLQNLFDFIKDYVSFVSAFTINGIYLYSTLEDEGRTEELDLAKELFHLLLKRKSPSTKGFFDERHSSPPEVRFHQLKNSILWFFTIGKIVYIMFSHHSIFNAGIARLKINEYLKNHWLELQLSSLDNLDLEKFEFEKVTTDSSLKSSKIIVQL
ncbi:MAG: hypothetical protein ACXAEU_11865 [Candidatus Hodarchaeales archaeon]|jgi:hypothetical protein